MTAAGLRVYGRIKKLRWKLTDIGFYYSVFSGY
jgi:hypothetical protein